MAGGGLRGAAGNRRGSAIASEGGGVFEAANVAGVRDQGGGDLVAGAEEILDGVAVLFEQRRDLGFELGDPAVETLDVGGELVDCGRGDARDHALAEADALE